jgi:sugar lactone lactonase YvrE
MQRSSSNLDNDSTGMSRPAASGWRRVAGLLLALAASTAPCYLAAQVPAVVATSQTALTATTGIKSGQNAADACGNVYVNPTSGNIVQILAGSGTVNIVSTNTNSYNNGPSIAIDPAKANLYYVSSSQWYSDAFTKVPIVNCTLGTPVVIAPSTGCPANAYYYGTAQFLAPDASGNIFFVPSACNTLIDEYLATGKVINVLATWPNSLTSLAVDLSGNIYFTDKSTNVYQVKPPFPGTATTFASGFSAVAGVSVDAQGNLLIADSGASTLYEIPNGSSGLIPASQFAVASVALTNFVSSDLTGSYYTSNASGPLAVRPYATFASTAVASAAPNATVNYVFNSAVTPATISVKAGASPNPAFAPASGGTCIAGTAYIAGQKCSVNVAYTPTAPGQQKAAVVLANAVGTPLNEFSISGIGLGAAATIDPGTLTQSGSGFKTPSGVASGPDGSVYVADTTAGTITVFPPGSTSGTTLGTGTLTLSGPNGVAVDSAGNVYIADTGNNRIVEVPLVNGALSSAGSVAYTAGLAAPAGLAFGSTGVLYIADTGNKRILAVTDQGGTLDFAAPRSVGSGLGAPSAITVDTVGDIFVSDSVNNVVYEFLGGITQSTVITGLNAPSALAMDASGSLFVADKGSFNVYRYPNNAGIFGTRTIVSNGILNPIGLAIDLQGNLYVADSTNSVVEKIVRSVGALAFGAENVKTPSSPLSAAVNSSGTQPLTLPSPSYSVSGNTTAGFAVTSDGCGTVGTVAVGSSCSITAQFTPPAVAPTATETLTLNSNAAIGGQSIVLSGTGRIIVVPTIIVALTSPASSQGLLAGQPVTFTVTINTGTGTATPGGTMKLFVNGNQVSATQVNGTTVPISLPNGLLDGTVNISAVYSGDQLNYSSATGSLALVVAGLPTTLTLSFGAQANSGVIIFTNPTSVNDYSGNSVGPALQLTATLNYSSNVIPGGTVNFYSGSPSNPTLLGMGSVILPKGGTQYQATIPTTALRAGTTNVVENNAFLTTYNFYAVYSGDTTYSTATSPTTPLSVVGSPANCSSSSDGCAGYCTSTAGSACAKYVAGTLTTCPLFSSTTCISSPDDGATFSIAPVSSTIAITSTTSTGQGSGSTTLNVTSYGGWQGVLAFTCTGLPKYATCSSYPGAPLINFDVASAPIPGNQVQFTIYTNVPPSDTAAASFLWEVAGLSGLALLLLRRRIGFLQRKSMALFGLVLFLAGAMMSMQGCSTGTTEDITPAGNSTVTVYVNAAQGISGGGTEYAPDVNTPSFQIQLVVK